MRMAPPAVWAARPAVGIVLLYFAGGRTGWPRASTAGPRLAGSGRPRRSVRGQEVGHERVELGRMLDLGPVAAAAENVQARVRQELEQPPARRQRHDLVVAAVDDEGGRRHLADRRLVR